MTSFLYCWNFSILFNKIRVPDECDDSRKINDTLEYFFVSVRNEPLAPLAQVTWIWCGVERWGGMDLGTDCCHAGVPLALHRLLTSEGRLDVVYMFLLLAVRPMASDKKGRGGSH